MDVRVLGPVVAESDGEQVAVSANQRLLVALLAAHAERIVPADHLSEALWGDDQPRNPIGSLQNLVSRLRARLGVADADALVTRAPGYGLQLAHCSVDWVEFERLVSTARAAPEPRHAVDAYRAGLALWRGRPYAEFDDPDLRQHAAWLDELGAAANEELQTLAVRFDPAAAVAELEALVARAPLRERGQALLMEALYRCGRRPDALRVFARYRSTLADELGLDPSPALRRLEHAILTDAVPDGTPAGSPGARGNAGAVRTGGVSSGPSDRVGNLITRRTSFVGRLGELEELDRVLRRQRCVSLVGVGGAGKTSLAVEAARRIAHRFDDGVWFVDLVQWADGKRLAEHAAGVVRLAALAPDDPVGSLLEQLRDRRLLLVLDNCEHMIDEVASFVDALLDGPDGIRILATSREPLRVAGELVHRVDPLGLPPLGAAPPDVVASASGHLFVDRVRGADPAYEPLAEDTDVIATICRRLDGLPLALELAAARVPSLGLREVARRLDDRFGLLSSNRRGVVERHQTLRAAISWSVGLLDDRQRRLLGRLSVFVGGFDLAAAEVVCADESLRSDQIAEALAVLVERSLVVRHRGAGGARYRLLETIREYAEVHLAGDAEVARRRHLGWYRELAKAVGDGFLVRTTSWYARLRDEFPDLRAAFQRAMAHGDVTAALDVAASLRWAPFNTGELYAEHREWIELALSAARQRPVDEPILGRGLVAAGAVAGLENRSSEAVALLVEAMHLLEAFGASEELVWCDMWLGAFHADLGNFRAAVEHTGRGLQRAQQGRSAVAVTYLANQHAEVAMAASWLIPDPACAAIASEAYAVATAAAEQQLVEEGLVRAEHGLALLDAAVDPAASLAACRGTLAAWRRLGRGNRLIMALISSARVAILAGDHELSRALIAEAVDAVVRVGWRQPLGRLLETVALCALLAGDTSRGAVLAGAASARFRTPRWYVPLAIDEHAAAGRSALGADWDLAAAAGRSMGDDAVLQVAREVCLA